MPTLALRPTTPDDAPFLADLHTATRSAEVAAFGWDAPAADAFLAQQHTVREAAYAVGYPGAEDRVLTVDGTAVGRALAHRGDGVLHLVDLALLPAYQGQGIGSAVLRGLLDDAASSDRVVRLSVRADNAGARRLYERAGFFALDETGFDVPMEARP